MQLISASYKATIVHATNPDCTAVRRRVYELVEPTSPRAWALERGIDLSRSIIRVGDDYWLRARWDDLIPEGALIHVIPIAGSGGGSNPLQAVLMIAVAVAAIYTGGLAAAAYGSATGVAAGVTTLGMTIVQAGVTMAVMAAGSMLVNAIVPPQSARVAQSATTSPTYALGASGNTARLLEAIPVLYGRMKITPDLAAQAYTEYAGNDLYLYQLFCVSKGDVDIEQILIGSTDISSFSEIEYQIVGPNQPVTLFPDNVVTADAVSGLELQAPNDGGDWVGPFVANPAGTSANYIGIDASLPSGLFYAADDGSFQNMSVAFVVEAQLINEAGQAIADWIQLDNRALTMSTSQPQVISYRYPVAAGRYQVRAKRTNNLNTDSRAQNRIQWAALRAYLPSERYYGNVTLLAMRMRATNSLNSSTAHDVNVIATRKLPVWTGVLWTEPQPTTSIAWAIADAARNSDYSLGLPDSRLDLDELLRLDRIWSTRGDEFNGVFDSVGSFWDSLTTICAAGRAVPMYFGGVISVVRDELKTVRTALFTPAKIAAGSLEIDYAFYAVDSPDYVTIEYYDETTWSWQTVSCIPTGSPALKEKRIQMVGPTKRRQAWAEGLYKAYANRDQRKGVKITTDLAGLIPLYGDLVGVAHDLPAWGIFGEVDHVEGVYVHTTQVLEWTPDAQHYVYFVRRNGAPTDALRVAQDIDSEDGQGFILLDPLPDGFYFSDGYSEDPTAFSFGPSIGSIVQDLRMLSATPRDAGQVDLVFVNNATSPHTAEEGLDPPAPVSPSQLPGVIHAPIVAQMTANSKLVPGSVVLTAAPAAGALHYEFQGSADGGSSWSALGDSPTNTVTVAVGLGTWIFRVRAFGQSGLAGPYAEWTGEVEQFKYLPVAPTLTLRDAFTSDDLSVEIQRSDDVDYYHVRISIGGVVKYETEITAQNFYWSLAQAQQTGAVAPAFEISVAGGNIAGLGPYGQITATSAPPSAPSASATASSDTLGTLSWSAVGSIRVASWIVRNGSTTVYSGTATSCQVEVGKQYSVVAVGNWGAQSAATIVTVNPPTPPDSGTGGGG
ncbi:host specificity factor TipJ family phage tail protein [Burkholderia gladioli]|uniref:host specificity factor TipJ family phage tail protein n=1 Tax=Burkholderia gladioli TaxID=28095 RepID=UPI0016401859|nr:host specificity factor TipJ family phage tail protein [Burkholderia gladioli]